MTELILYTEQYFAATLRRIEAFWGFHSGLVGREDEAEQTESGEESPVLDDLRRWTAEDHRLYVILQDGQDVGFVHLYRAGPIVMELADIFVDKERRGQRIATRAIALAEQRAKEEPGVEAMVLQGGTRNEDALRLYHCLGYDTMSMVTLRKEFYENRRDRKADFLGMTFRI